MRVFEDPMGYFEVQVPADWGEETDLSESQIYSASDSEGNGTIAILVSEGILVSLTEFVDALESEFLEVGAEVLARNRADGAGPPGSPFGVVN